MDLDTLAKLGEFVGGFFVVLSLVYLAHQVRMNTKSLRSENYARLLERMSTLQSRVAAEPDLNRVFTVGSEDPGRLTRSERIRYAWALYDMFGTAEFMFHQSRAKALPKGVWTRWEATIGWWFSHPGVRAWWAGSSGTRSPGRPTARQSYPQIGPRTSQSRAGDLDWVWVW